MRRKRRHRACLELIDLFFLVLGASFDFRRVMLLASHLLCEETTGTEQYELDCASEPILPFKFITSYMQQSQSEKAIFTRYRGRRASFHNLTQKKISSSSRQSQLHIHFLPHTAPLVPLFQRFVRLRIAPYRHTYAERTRDPQPALTCTPCARRP